MYNFSLFSVFPFFVKAYYKKIVFFLYFHRALNKVTQSANQHVHTFNFLFIKTYLKFLKTLLHVSVIRPSSGSL